MASRSSNSCAVVAECGNCRYLFVQTIGLTTDPGLPHQAAEAIGVVAGAPMHQAAIIPDDQITGLPVMAINMRVSGCFFGQILDQSPAFSHLPAIDLSRMAAEVKVFRPERGLVRTIRC